jgi:serine/threonine protein kinase
MPVGEISMIGKSVSHYQIIDQLGKGGMGEVFLAHDTSLDRKVALKFLPDIFSSDPERLARFKREAKLLASLNHPNIAAISGFETAEGRCGDTLVCVAAGDGPGLLKFKERKLGAWDSPRFFHSFLPSIACVKRA